MRAWLRVVVGLGLLLLVAGGSAYAGFLYGIEMMAEVSAAQRLDRAIGDAATTLGAMDRLESTSAREVLDDRLRTAAVAMGQHVHLDHRWRCSDRDRKAVRALRGYLEANPSPPGDFRLPMYVDADRDSLADAIKLCD